MYLGGLNMSEKKDDSLKDDQTPDENQDSPKSDASSAAGRGQFHKKKRGPKNLMGSLIWVIIILAIASLAYYMTQRQDFQQKTANTTTTQVAKSSTSKEKSDKKKSSKASSKSSESSSAKSKSSETSSSATSSSAAETSSVETSSSSAVISSSSSVSDNNSAQGNSYATVQSGQGLYRVAVNNGISVQKLMELNGLSSGSDIKPGQQLRVK